MVNQDTQNEENMEFKLLAKRRDLVRPLPSCQFSFAKALPHISSNVFVSVYNLLIRYYLNTILMILSDTLAIIL